uniref:Uncharacterized protein n=1 Tax=Oreochromis aureus TaxID=47969 RepID=A0AAZ1XGP8_OREAU
RFGEQRSSCGPYRQSCLDEKLFQLRSHVSTCWMVNISPFLRAQHAIPAPRQYHVLIFCEQYVQRETTQSTRPPTQSIRPSTQNIRPPTQSICPPTQRVHPPTQSDRPPTQSIRPPTQSIRPPTQRSPPPTQSIRPPTQRNRPPTWSIRPHRQSISTPTQSIHSPRFKRPVNPLCSTIAQHLLSIAGSACAPNGSSNSKTLLLKRISRPA